MKLPATFYCLLVFLFFSLSLQSQEVAYGFKAGLNFSRLDGVSELDSAVNSVEEEEMATGFHVGAEVKFKITELMGFKTGLVFSQRGGRRRFDGDGFQFFIADSGNRVKAEGARRTVVNVTNSYLDVPLTGYALRWERLEIFAGGQISFLVGSNGTGDFSFDGNSAITNTPILIETQLLTHNYYNDGSPNIEDFQELELFTIQADGEFITIPEEVTAYYNFGEKDGSIYNILDVGLHAGFSYFFNKGLYTSFTFQYGLLDATRDRYDVSQITSNELQYIERDDVDRNLSLQVSIGFSF